jgi:hypothetical protein
LIWLSPKSQERARGSESEEEREPLSTVDGNINWHIHYGKQYGGSSKKLKTEWLYTKKSLF